MIGKISKVRHAMVGAAIGGTTLLAATGIIGGQQPERFDAKTFVIAREGDVSLRITEFVDIDFGDTDRHGYLRQIPNDFGAPKDVFAASPDAPDDVFVIPQAGYTEIRIGDPNSTVNGQHRYELSYTLPDAHYDEFGAGLRLMADVVFAPGGVYPGDFETGRFEVVVTGYRLGTTECDVWEQLGDTGGCDLSAAEDGTWRTVVEPLGEDLGLTVGGSILGFTDPVAIDPPPLPERRSGTNPGLIALAFAGLGIGSGAGVHRWARRRGRNEVFAGGAADAAYGTLPPPGSGRAAPSTQLVADDDFGDLATVEFVPPKGVAAWEAAVLLEERVHYGTVEAWLSDMVGREALDVEQHGSNLKLSAGPKLDELSAPDIDLLRAILVRDPYITGSYDPAFATAWNAVYQSQRERIATSGWWKHLPPGTGVRVKGQGSRFGLIGIFMFVLIWGASAVTAFVGIFQHWFLAIALGLVFPALIAYFMYRVLLPARSAQGSSLALQAESFRRFLHASEGKHVEWAWSKGLLREYSAWAVALGEAEAWSAALGKANVPAPARAAAGPIIVHTGGSSLRDSRTAPSSSGNGSSDSSSFGGGGGGFSGGGGGGGGGGGSSGSW